MLTFHSNPPPEVHWRNAHLMHSAGRPLIDYPLHVPPMPTILICWHSLDQNGCVRFLFAFIQQKCAPDLSCAHPSINQEVR